MTQMKKMMIVQMESRKVYLEAIMSLLRGSQRSGACAPTLQALSAFVPRTTCAAGTIFAG